MCRSRCSKSGADRSSSTRCCGSPPPGFAMSSSTSRGSENESRRDWGTGRSSGYASATSRESDGALDTGGGIRRALPLLGEPRFAVVNSDVWSDYPLAELRGAHAGDGHIVLVDNPAHHPDGDFALASDGKVVEATHGRLTFTGIGCYRPRLFSARSSARFPLAAVSARGHRSGDAERRAPPGRVGRRGHAGAARSARSRDPRRATGLRRGVAPQPGEPAHSDAFAVRRSRFRSTIPELIPRTSAS